MTHPDDFDHADILDDVLEGAIEEYNRLHGAKARAASADAKGLFDLIGLARSGVIGGGMELWDAIKTRDPAEISREIGDMLVLLGQPEYKPQIDLFTVELLKGPTNWAAIGSAWSDIQKLVFEEFRKKAEGFKIQGRKPVEEYTAEEARQWFAENKGTIRTTSKTWLGKKILKRVPELQGMIDGTASPESLESLALMEPDKAIRLLNILIFACTVGACINPLIGLIGTALEFRKQQIIRQNPDIGLSVKDFAG